MRQARAVDVEPRLSAPGVPRPVWTTSEVVAFAVARDIVEHGLQSGDRLPLEAEMVGQYGVDWSSAPNGPPEEVDWSSAPVDPPKEIGPYS